MSSPPARPSTETVEALRLFLAARHSDISAELAAAGVEMEALSGATRMWFHAVYADLSTHAAFRIQREARAGQFTAPAKHRWWAMLTLARAYADHPDFPETVRPYLKRAEWQ